MGLSAELTISADQQQAKTAGSKVAEVAGKAMSESFKKSIKQTYVEMDRILGRGLAQSFQVQTGPQLQQAISQNISKMAQSAKLKASADQLGNKFASTVSKALGAQIDPKTLSATYMRSFKDAERESVRQQRKAERVADTAKKRAQSEEARQEKKDEQQKLREKQDADKLSRYRTTRMREEMTRILAHPLLKAVGMENLPTNLKDLGAARGAAVTAAQVGMGFIEKAVGFGKQREELLMQTAPMLGQFRGGRFDVRRAYQASRAQYGFSAPEAAQWGARAGAVGAGGARDAILRAERGLGVGEGSTQLLGAMAQKGIKIDWRDPRVRQTLPLVVGMGFKSGLETGRFGEVFRGMAQMMSGRGFGQRADFGPAFAQALIGLGKAGIRGQEAFEGMRGLEGLIRAPKTGLGRALAMQAVGLGTSRTAGGVGGDIYAAERRSEKGLFGEGAQNPMETLSRYVTTTKETFGLGGKGLGREIVGDEQAEMRRGAALKELALNADMTATGMEKLITAYEEQIASGRVDQKELERIAKEGQSLQTKATNAVLGLIPLKKTAEEMQRTLEAIYKELGPLLSKHILPVLQDLLRVVAEWLPKIVKAIHILIDSMPQITKEAKNRADVMMQQLFSPIRSLEDPTKVAALARGPVGAEALRKARMLESKGQSFGELPEAVKFLRAGGQLIPGQTIGEAASRSKLTGPQKEQFIQAFGGARTMISTEMNRALLNQLSTLARAVSDKNQTVNNIVVEPGQRVTTSTENRRAKRIDASPFTAGTNPIPAGGW